MISSNTGEGESSSTFNSHVDKDVEMTQTDEEQQKLNELITKWTAMMFEDSELSTLAQKIQSSEPEVLHHGVIGLRKLLSKESQQPLIQQVIDTGIVPRLVHLTFSSIKRVRLEAAWCLTNLCSGTTQQTLNVVENGAISSFISLLSSDDADVVDQSVWGLGNIAGDSAKFRDMILEQNGTEAMVKVLAKTSNANLKRNGVWALSNFCRGKPGPKFELICSVIPLFCEYLNAETDSKVLSNIAGGLSSISATEAGIQSLLNQNVVPKLIELLSHNDTGIQTPSLRIIGNIISGTDEQASVVLKEKNFIPELFKLVEHPKESIRRETFWILSNITAGTPVQLEAIMGNPVYVEKMIHVAKNDCNEVKNEVIWALSNSTKQCTPAQIMRILNNGVFGYLVDLLDEQDAKLLRIVLEGISNCLKWGEQFNIKDESGINKFVVEIESKGGVEKIENLQTHPNNEVYKHAFTILTTYFVLEE